MKKKLFVGVIVFLIFGFFAAFQRVDAASFSLTKIGAMNTNGATYSEWWYTGENPTLQGTAGSGASVSVSIDDESGSATADGSGNWSYSTSTLTTGDHFVSMSSEGESYSFTLHIGQDVPSSFTSTTEITESTTSVPETGFDQLISIVLTGSLFVTALLLFKGDDVRKVFEKSVLEDLD